MILDLLILLVALGLLTLGAETLVRGASRLTTRFNISSFVIGVTVVGFGTSAPELAASLSAATTGHEGMAVGNVIGSNIMNIALVLGITALIVPIPVKSRVIRRETIFTIGVSFLPLLALANGGVLSRGLGIMFVIGLVAEQVETCWQWHNYLARACPVGKTTLTINVDETYVNFFQGIYKRK